MASDTAPGVTTLETPVVDVTLFEDRARIVRVGRASLSQGEARVRLEGVSPVLADMTLSVSVEGHGARVVDACVRRRIVTRPTGDDRLDELEKECERLDAELARSGGRLELLKEEAVSYAELASLSLDEIAEEVAWDRGDATAWSERLDQLRERERDVVRRLVELSAERSESQRTRARVAQRMAAPANPARDEWAAVEIDVSVDTTAEHEIRVEYVVPGACWRPYHTAQLIEDDAGGASIEFRTDACVWQNTGEEWREVQLRFSTERPSLGTDPPRLQSDVLSVRKKSAEIEVEARDEEIETTGLGLGRGVAAPRLPGIDDGGESVLLEAGAAASIASDGRPNRVALEGFRAPVELSLVAIPECVEAVLTKSVLTNGGSAPILAGPVDLIREGGFAGRTHTLFVAPGERFELGWGPAPELRAQRHTESAVVKEAKLLRFWEQRRHRVWVRLSNLGSRPRRVEVTERVPVSEIEKVVVEPDTKATTDGIEPNADGFVRWTATLPPNGTKTLELAYTLKKHEAVTGI